MNKREMRDGERHRLSLFLEAECGWRVRKAERLKPHVWVVDTDCGKRILKKYRSFFEASRQMTFVRLLRKSGFQAAPSIEGMVAYGESYWIVQEYIEGARPLTFKDERDRTDGLQLLQHYHAISPALFTAPFFRTMLSPHNLYEKWKRRYEWFRSYMPIWERVMKRDELLFTVQCADYFMANFPNESGALSKERASILHGDVASHNFLRTKQGDVYLIDYDLMAIAPPSIDYLQYVSRVLPHVQWSLAYLEDHPLFQPLLAQRWFLLALLFPADVMRECRTLALTRKPFAIPSFECRKQFVRKMIGMLR